MRRRQRRIIISTVVKTKMGMTRSCFKCGRGGVISNSNIPPPSMELIRGFRFAVVEEVVDVGELFFNVAAESCEQGFVVKLIA